MQTCIKIKTKKLVRVPKNLETVAQFNIKPCNKCYLCENLGNAKLGCNQTY